MDTIVSAVIRELGQVSLEEKEEGLSQQRAAYQFTSPGALATNPLRAPCHSICHAEPSTPPPALGRWVLQPLTPSLRRSGHLSHLGWALVHSKNNRVMETNLSHFLARVCEDNVTEGICWHLCDMLFRVPLLVLEGVRPRGLLQVLLTWVAALTHHLPAKAAGSPGATDACSSPRQG